MHRWLFIAGLLWLPACGSSGGGGDDAGVTINPGDFKAAVPVPEIKDFRVEVEGDFVVTFDLDLKDDEYTLSGPAKAMVSVLIEDEVDAPQELTVVLVDSGEAAAEEAEALVAVSEFEDGLWQFELTLRPGMRLQVRASNSLDGMVVSKHGLNLPGLDSAVARLWRVRVYDDKGAQTASWPWYWKDDASWVEEAPDGDRRGMYQMSGPVLTFWQTDGPDTDGDPTTVDWKFQCDHFVDEEYFLPCPYERKSGADGLVGQWVRVVLEYKPETDFQDPEPWTETLTFTAEGKWFRDFVGSRGTASGTYDMAFLQEPVEGEELIVMEGDPEGTLVHLVVIRSGKLLLSPLVGW